MNAPVCTYFEHLPESHPDGRELLELWCKNWGLAGWQTIVLGIDWARDHPRYMDLIDVTDALPTNNPRPYEFACWVRWCAYSMAAQEHGVIVATDQDIANLSWEPRRFGTRLVAYAPGLTSVVSGGPKAFDGWIEAFLSNPKLAVGDYQGTPHASDESFSGQRADLFDYQPACQNYPDISAPLVHVKTNLVPPGETKVELFSRLTRTTGAETFDVEQDATTDGGAAPG